MWRTLPLVLAFLAGLSAARAEPIPRRVAVVVGVGAYQAVPPLANPPRDARAVAASLRKLGFDTTLLIDPDRAALEQAIRALGDKSADAEAALFFYAGHGLEADGRNFIVPVSAKIASLRDLPFETVDLDLVGQQVEGRARTVLVFLDACRDNPFAQRLGSARGVRVGGGLAAPEADGSGTLIAFATAPGHTAEDGAGNDSPFTTALLRHIATPGLEVRQMLGLVRRDVREATAGKQVPWESSALEGAFYFNPDGAAQAQAPPPASGPSPVAPISPRGPGAPAAPGPQPARAEPRRGPPALLSRCHVARINGIRKQGGAETVMEVASDGRGCAFRIFVHATERVPFDSLVASTPPANGTVHVNNNAQIVYTPNPGYVGADRFILNTLPRGTLAVRVIVKPPLPEQPG
jgi:hypothetical protein